MGCIVDGSGPVTGPTDDDGDGYAEADGDCDDGDPRVFPGATEVCNDVDDDCNGEIDDEASDPRAWWPDLDGDGYGDAAAVVWSCQRPDGHVADGRDCDDTSAEISPGVVEQCNGLDDDCDARVDDADPDIQYGPEHAWHVDVDGDGYGDATGPVVHACGQPASHVDNALDCNDANGQVNPDGVETCALGDEDCDGLEDDDDPDRDSTGALPWWPDGDGDGVGAGAFIRACTLPSGYSAVDGDCDDADPLTYPGAPELCDGLDNACDGGTDDGTASFVDGTDAWADWTAILGAGTEDEPAAVTIASSGSLWVCAGTWYVHLSVDAAEFVLGGTDPSTVVLSGGGHGRVLDVVSAEQVLVSGVTLERGVATEGGILRMSSGDLEVRNAELWFGSATVGGALWRAGGTTLLEDIEIRACEASELGGGLYLSEGDTLIMDGRFWDTSALRGGGIHAEDASVALTDTEMLGNDASEGGGALSVVGGTLSIAAGVLDGNTAGDGDGGALWAVDAEVLVSDSLLEHNLAYGNGGAAVIDGGFLEMVRTELSVNDAALADGGALWLLGSDAVLDAVSFSSNSASENGGAVLLHESALVGTGLAWADNSPDDLYVRPVELSYMGVSDLSCDGSGCE